MAEQSSAVASQAAHFKEVFSKIRAEVNKMMVGQSDVIDGVLTALLAGGHVLLEGVPGLGKTMIVRCLSDAVHLGFSRIQFTPDMMPADIQGTMVLTETEGGGHELNFQQGPLISNLILADEINRATPKTQSALLEAMQEKQVTVGSRTIRLDEPYCVMATQNPVEQEGTYPLPEAQLDRFLFKLIVGYPEEHEYGDIVDRTTGSEEVVIDSVATGADILSLREIARSVAVPSDTKSYAIKLVIATQPQSKYAPESVNKYTLLGSSPRGVQGLMLAGKVQALLNDRFAVSTDDVKKIAHDVLRHRLILNFQAQASNVTTDTLIDDILSHVKTPHAVN
ncbi:MAG: MoxR family ATPase [Gammaproteobacteria bacterium]|nr:MoxR family ATPase [Gammaproteobacteria bacterium]MDE0251642.1 MoxR family ATPase [Gammaproteobacteria bacterium]MDE0403348.1 MoxR family ATPase [Gammaproteobacteria bacterium]MDE0645130.1 MoxR family ATPase [Gammaproteobacteria bacterium]